MSFGKDACNIRGRLKLAMKKSTQIYIWLPPRSVGERTFLSEMSSTVMVVGATSEPNETANARYYRSSLDALEGVRAVSLIFDARDVTLLNVALPALSGAKLAKALPNAVEDLLLQDVNACAIVIGARIVNSLDSMVGVIDRAWLDLTVAAFERKGIRVNGAYAAQLVLPLPAGAAESAGTSWALACYQNGLALRTDSQAGFGWGASEDPSFNAEAISSALLAARQSTGANSPEVAVYVENEDWKQPALKVLEQVGLKGTISSLPIPQITADTIDFMGQRSGSRGSRFMVAFNWRAWRIPAYALAAAMACYLIGLNLHWGQLAQEKGRLKAESERRFRQAFPQTQVVVDPLLQMQRNIATLRAQAGQAGPEDFVPIAVKLSNALATVAPLAGAAAPVRAGEAIQNLDYRAAKLRVKFLPGLMDNRNNREAISAVGARFGLKFEFDADNVLIVGAQT
jgi:general secretion pathway protein L